MDIDILLWLQDLRLAAGPAVEHAFVLLSSLSINALFLLVPFGIYWCFDKAKGFLAIASFAMANASNQLVKNTATVYRPWIRDARIQPAAEALGEATGYSFPSGHTVTATTTIGALGWAWRKRVWPLVLTVLYVLLVAFSRNFLGCHTPQDVLVALVESCLVIWFTSRLITWVDAAEGRDLIVLVAGLVLVVAFLVYVTVKPYPIDYVDGKLLVDPAKMTVDCFKAGGCAAGFLVGWFMERRLVGFSTEGIGAKQRVLRFVVGAVVVLLFHLVIGKAFSAFLGEFAAPLLRYGLTFFCAVFLAPLAFSLVEKRAFSK
ncbi:MAG: phosphatase PAP2 family protein [Olsenella sp.]|nr:phosphatase PAP2 family protein [Olsenella sp.]